jgi:hypothetical protein
MNLVKMSPRFSWSAFWAGIRGGFFATAVMTVFRAPTAQSLPPTAEFLERYLRGAANEYPLTSLVLHFLYGTSAGALFGPLSTTVVGETNEPETVGIAIGTIYGLTMSILAIKSFSNDFSEWTSLPTRRQYFTLATLYTALFSVYGLVRAHDHFPNKPSQLSRRTLYQFPRRWRI